MCGHKTLGTGMNNPAEHDRIASELADSIAVAGKHGIPNLIVFSGNRREDQSDEEGLAVCAQILKRVAPMAEDAGINLNMELLNSKVDHPGYQCDHSAWGFRLCEEVDSPRVKMLYDIYHMQIMEGDIIRTIRENIQWIGHFHTAGNPGRFDMDDTQELNYHGICSAIAETDYDGFLAHEFKPKADPVDALRAAYAICNKG
jgi:hydroxypyruvate isomerase